MRKKYITVDTKLLDSENVKIDKSIKESIARGEMSVFTKKDLLRRVEKSGELASVSETLMKLDKIYDIPA